MEVMLHASSVETHGNLWCTKVTRVTRCTEVISLLLGLFQHGYKGGTESQLHYILNICILLLGRCSNNSGNKLFEIMKDMREILI